MFQNQINSDGLFIPNSRIGKWYKNLAVFSDSGLMVSQNDTLVFANGFFCKPSTCYGFSSVRNSYFSPDLCKAALATIRFIRLAPNPAL
jgi:hypothetical protein